MHATQPVLAITVPARPVHGLSQPARPLLGAQPHLVKDPHGKPKAKSHTYYARRTTINYTAGVAVRSGSAVVEIPRRGFAGSEKGSRDAEVRVRPVAVALSVGLLLASFDTEPAQAVVGGFEDSSVARGTGLPVALDFTPDHRVLVADKTGRLQVYEADGTRLSTALDLSGEVCANAERGLLGVVVDPSFETNNFVYLYYTHKKFTACPEGQPARRDNPVNRVSRFVMNGNTIDPASEKAPTTAGTSARAATTTPRGAGRRTAWGAPFTPPLHEYSHSTGCESITGGGFVPNSAGWPDSYNSSYLFGDFVCNRIFKLTPKGGGGFNKTAFAGAPRGGGVIAMDFGPFGSRKALYYTTFANGGEVRRIAFTGR